MAAGRKEASKGLSSKGLSEEKRLRLFVKEIEVVWVATSPWVGSRFR